MMDIHSKYVNMHTNEKFNTLICVNNHVNSCINYMLSVRGVMRLDVDCKFMHKLHVIST